MIRNQRYGDNFQMMAGDDGRDIVQHYLMTDSGFFIAVESIEYFLV